MKDLEPNTVQTGNENEQMVDMLLEKFIALSKLELD
jgi:hypothetical protein